MRAGPPRRQDRRAEVLRYDRDVDNCCVLSGSWPALAPLRRQPNGQSPTRGRRYTRRTALLSAVGLLAAGCRLSTVLQRRRKSPLAPAAAASLPRRSSPDTVLVAAFQGGRYPGILEVLADAFEAAGGPRIELVVGSLPELRSLAEQGKIDALLLAHPPTADQLEAGRVITARTLVMYADLLLVGPATDPARCQAVRDLPSALRQIAELQATFISRSDNPVVHFYEQRAWTVAGVVPRPPWYIFGGSGPGRALESADERRAYTLTRRGIYLDMRQRIFLDIVLQNDPLLVMPFEYLQVSPQRSEGVNAAGAAAFRTFLLSREGQEHVAAYGLDTVGEPLYRPVNPVER
jgi:tungstate transport system substrate-binding protein